MHILDKIAAHKTLEVTASRKEVDIKQLEDRPAYHRTCYSMSAALASEGPSILAEHKRRSPSRPSINLDAHLPSIVEGYATAGAAGISILTDEYFFGGSAADLVEARNCVDIPLLRKDFIIDRYQLTEAKAWGADCILLISELLDAYQVADFAAEAKDLGLDVLLEMHSDEHLDKITSMVDIVGINNRDLKRFVTDIEYSVAMIEQLPSDICKISESGLQNPSDIRRLHRLGYDGFLIGESFMKAQDPGAACKQLHVALTSNTASI